MIEYRKRQLYSLTEKNFKSPSYIDFDGKLVARPANDIPLIIWPDGSWCHPANTFIREQFEKGLSRLNRGGSLTITASNISHLLRFCWKSKIDLINLTDNDFSLFVADLIMEKRSKQPEQHVRSSSSVISICRSCLQFLDSIARHTGDSALIGPEGRIRASLMTSQTKISGRKKSTKTTNYWHHASLPKPSAMKKRLPISTDNIELLRIAAGKLYRNKTHQRLRFHTIIKLLEVTGARRGEIAYLTVESVLQASVMEMPMLRIQTLKKSSISPQYRYVPISLSDIFFLLQYVNIHRNSVIKRKLKNMPDHGVLLISDKTGEPYQPNTITQEINRIARIAGINEKACPHMFRHRFLTKLFVALIEQHNVENPDNFRRMLLDAEGLKFKVAEWTNHTNMETLDRYINLAFEEVGNYKSTYKLVSVNLALDSFRGNLEAEIQALTVGESPIAIAKRLLLQITALDLDLKNAKIKPTHADGI